MEVSVIIPVYNSKNYLNKCIESLINQTFNDIEFIFVNDGSTDNSLSILEQYSKKDSRIKIINQKNQGISQARNRGMKEAKGRYIGFIDSDDWVDLDFYQKLYSSIIETNADIAVSSIIRIGKNYQKYRVKYDRTETFESLEDKIKVCNIPKCCYVWNKLYRKEIIENLEFKKDVFYEDVIWLPFAVKNAKKLTTVNTNYYYYSNPDSTVKKVQSQKKQLDNYNAKKTMIDFFQKNNLTLSKKEKTITKKIVYCFNYKLLKIKEYENKLTYYLFGFIPIFKKTIKTPIVKDNTFIVWEPCSKSHAEVVPGYCRYLLDLNCHVCVLVNPKRYKEGLFSRFKDENITYSKLNRKEIEQYFKNNSLDNIKGVLVTTVGKICDSIHYNNAYNTFSSNTNKKKLLFVEHESKPALDNGSWNENLITLRKINYKNAKSVVVNPHYFGEVKITPKNPDITNFITIGAIRPNKKNSQMIVEAAKTLHNKGYRNFRITVVGKGDLKSIPKEIKQYFDIKGRLTFDRMYSELEKADFMLTSYNINDPEHIRYNTTGTSGNFQLVYGFLKPCIIAESFAPINGFNSNNAIFYKEDDNYPEALIKAINMSSCDYKKMQDNLKILQQSIYNESLENLKRLINE